MFDDVPQEIKDIVAKKFPQRPTSCPVCKCDFVSKTASSDLFDTHRAVHFYFKTYRSEILFGFAYQERTLAIANNWYYCMSCQNCCKLK
jgi:hypothetical protein